jgi:hypothetical protein
MPDELLLIHDGRENLPDTSVPEHGEICSHLRYAFAYNFVRFVLQDMENNFRPVQELNNRDVSLFRPIPHKHY